MVLLQKVSEETNMLVHGLYPDRFREGLHFTLGTFELIPYVNLATKHGVELLAIIEYCRYYNMTLTINDCGRFNWGDHSNNYIDGIMGGVNYGNFQAGIAGYYFQGDKLQHFDYALPITRIGETLLVPIPRLEASLFLPVIALAPDLWLCIISTMIAFVVVWGTVERFRYMKNEGFRSAAQIFSITAAIFLQQSTNLTRITLGFLFGLMLLFTLVISMIYSSKLYLSITTPSYVGIINNLKDLEESDLYWGANDLTYIDLLQDGEHKNLVKRFITANETELVQKLFRGKFGLLLEHLTYGYVIPSFLTAKNLKKFVVMKEDLFWTYGIVMLQQQSVYQPSLNMHIRKIWEAGLPLHWEHQSFYEDGLFKVQMELKDMEHSGYKPLTLYNIAGVFVFWTIGLLASAACCVYENKIYNALQCLLWNLLFTCLPTTPC